MLWADGEPNQKNGALEDKIVLFDQDNNWKWIDEFPDATTNGFWRTHYKALCEIREYAGALGSLELWVYL